MKKQLITLTLLSGLFASASALANEHSISDNSYSATTKVQLVKKPRNDSNRLDVEKLLRTHQTQLTQHDTDTNVFDTPQISQTKKFSQQTSR